VREETEGIAGGNVRISRETEWMRVETKEIR
jgi:hypothetical protein